MAPKFLVLLLIIFLLSPYECLGYGQSTTVREFVDAYRKINQLDFKVKVGNRRTGDKEISEVPFVSHYMKQNYSLEQLVFRKNIK